MLLKIDKKSSIDLLLGQVQLFLVDYISDKTLQMECKTIVSEIIYNIHKYASQGSVKLHIENKLLSLKAQDNGKGIPNLNDAIKDGYSTSNTLGLGLATIFRLSDEIDIQTSENGTMIELKKRIK